MEDVGIFRDWPHIVLWDQVGKDALGDFAVLEHVAHPTGGAQVVLQDIKIAILIPDQVKPYGMKLMRNPNAETGVLAVTLVLGLVLSYFGYAR